MSTTTNKRPSTSTSRKSKKARTAPSSAPLGSLLSSKAVLVKEESELELEEAVFGRTSRDRGKGAWDEDDVGTGGLGGFGAESDEDADEQDDEETGLERLRDENVSTSSYNAVVVAGVGVLAVAADSSAFAVASLCSSQLGSLTLLRLCSSRASAVLTALLRGRTTHRLHITHKL